MAKASPNTKLELAKIFYFQHKSGVISEDLIKQNCEGSELELTESDIQKVLQKLNLTEETGRDFFSFVEKYGLKKEKAVKVKPERTMGRTLPTKEAAESRGVAPENIEKYIELCNMVYEISGELNKLMSGHKVSFAIPIIKPAKAVDVTPEGIEPTLVPASVESVQ